jgi:hypothetical protein
MAYLTISGELLREILLLPADCELPGETIIPIEHPSIPADVEQVVAVFTKRDGVTSFSEFMWNEGVRD